MLPKREKEFQRASYQMLKELKRHVMSFLLLYNYQKKLKALKFQTPYDTIIQIYQDNPESKSLGLNIYTKKQYEKS